jgi:hypothetical protein
MSSVGRAHACGSARGSRARTLLARKMRGRDVGSIVLNDAEIEALV